MKKRITRNLIILTLAAIPGILFAFEGKVFSVTGNTVTVVGDGVAYLKSGQKFGVYSGDAKTGEIVVTQVSHTQAKAKIVSGTASKDADVREIAVEKKANAALISGRYRNNGDSTVTDTRTKLVWQRCSLGQNNDATCSGEAQEFNWEDAISACNTIKLAGKTWRLPEKEELKSLIYCSDGTMTEDIKDLGNGHPDRCGWSGGKKYKKKYQRPTINQNSFPAMIANGYWSSSTYVANTAGAWIVTFYSGNVYSTNKTLNNYVRCVSTGP